MVLFLTSSPCVDEDGVVTLNPAYGFVDNLRQTLPEEIRCLFVCSNPDDEEGTDKFAQEMQVFFERAGFVFSEFAVLDWRTAEQAEEMIEESDLLILAGGHVPTQNWFFSEIHLAELLQGYEGVVMGISAGSMNCAETVYAHPEEEGEAVDPEYQRFLPGLGLTDLNILPHFSQWREKELDGLLLLEEIALPDSCIHAMLILEDGSYVIQADGQAEVFGPHYWLIDGNMSDMKTYTLLTDEQEG